MPKPMRQSKITTPARMACDKPSLASMSRERRSIPFWLMRQKVLPLSPQTFLLKSMISRTWGGGGLKYINKKTRCFSEGKTKRDVPHLLISESALSLNKLGSLSGTVVVELAVNFSLLVFKGNISSHDDDVLKLLGHGRMAGSVVHNHTSDKT